MSGLNDNAVITAAIGYVYVADPGTAPPTPSQLASLNPETYGASAITVKITGSPTGGTFTVTVGGIVSSALPYNISNEAFQTAIEALSSVGAGNTDVTGVSLTDTAGLTIALVGELDGQVVTASGSGTNLTGGSTPAVGVTVSASPNGWTMLGHTSREDMPEFGYKGGEYILKGTWQRQRLRLVRDKEIPADHVTLNLEQWDETTLEYYFGADAATGEDGVFGVDGYFIPIEKAFLVIFKDGPVQVGFYASKSAITRSAAVKLPIDDFIAMPIKAIFLNMGVRRLYDWISEDLFVKS
jgi:hypothetical protein